MFEMLDEQAGTAKEQAVTREEEGKGFEILLNTNRQKYGKTENIVVFKPRTIVLNGKEHIFGTRIMGAFKSESSHFGQEMARAAHGTGPKKGVYYPDEAR